MSAFRYIATAFICVVSLFAQANPIADFKLSVKQGCVPLTVNFTNLSSGNGLSYYWEFGNGNNSVLQNPSAIYYQSGQFQVKLTVTDASGNKSVKVFSKVRVFSNPVAAFKADTVACTGQLLQFTDQSRKADTAIVQWIWDFGDGNLDFTQSPKHAYSLDGQFNIGLTVKDGFGCKSLTTKIKYVNIKKGPKASFNLDKTYDCQLPGVFKATNTSKDANNYIWEMSDGTTSTQKDHTTNFQNYGTYKIKLTATTVNGCFDYVEKTVVVEQLKARFDIVNTITCQGGKTVFSNTSSPNNKGIKYEWDFGDGSSDTARTPDHVYTTTGKYEVKLTMSYGPCKVTFKKDVTVQPVPEGDISVTDSVGCAAPFNAEFKVNSNDYNASYWTYGDESPVNQFVAKGQKITHTYKQKGRFDVKARIVNSYGCAIDVNLPTSVFVGDEKVRINPRKVSACAPHTQLFKLDEQVIEPIIDYKWSFTDSALVYTRKEVKRYFPKDGTFGVSVTVRTQGGCLLTDNAVVELGLHHPPTFTLKKKDYCNREALEMVNTSHDSVKNYPGIKFLLRFQDSSANTLDSMQPSFIYDSIIRTFKGGMYKIKLVAVDRGCETESAMADTIYVHGTYPKLQVRSLNCKNSKVLVKAGYSWANRVELYRVKTRIPYSDSLIAPYLQGDYYELKTYNDTFGCADTLREVPHITYHDPMIGHELSQPCAPSTGIFTHGNQLKQSKWKFSDGDTFRSSAFSKLFTKGGKYKVLLTGYYDSSNCLDSNFIEFTLDEVALRSRIISSGKCLPVTLSLYDTSASDNSLHTWKVNGQEFVTKDFKTDVVIDNIASGDSVIRVKHKVQSPTGCVSEKEFAVPVAGPVIRYTITRFANCDTPVFYFKTFVDSQRCRFPLTYRWESSSGYLANQPASNTQFKNIGMEQIRLTVTDAKGCVSSFVDSVEVSPNMLQPLFRATPTGRFCPPLTASFTDMSKTFNSEIVSWEWDFGDGTRSDLRNPSKLYLLPGKYDVKLTIRSRSGCVATLLKPGYIIVNGPRGSYDFDRGNACLPHTVEFRGKTLDSASMEWDLGDGVVRQGNNFKHTYNRAGRFIPAMILSDTLGCKYTLPPIDTIEVFNYPQAVLDVKGLCLKQPISISQKSVSNHQNAQLNYTWYFNDKMKSPGKDSVFMPEFKGINKIRLIVENIGTCKDTVEQSIRIFSPDARFEMKEKFLCLGMPLNLYNVSQSDSGFTGFEWHLGDGTTSHDKDVRHAYPQSGQYDVTLIATDKFGCKDTLLKPKYVTIGDTIPPENVPVRRASVLGDHAVELVFSKMNSFDFNSYSIYKESGNVYRKIREISSINDTIFTDNLCNTLDQSYCYKVQVKNLCQMSSNLGLAKEHCTIETKATGEFESNRVVWSPYIGFDKIRQYQIWRADESSPAQYELIDTTDGKTLKYIDSVMSCFTRKYYRIKAIQDGGFREYSNSDTAAAKPYYVNNTLPNYAWRTTVENNQFLRLEWLNNAWSRRGIKGYLVDKRYPDGRPIFTDRYFDAQDTVLEDPQVKVNDYSYVYTMRGIDNCLDTTPWSNPAQSILLKGDFDVQANKPKISWNKYREWSQGIDRYDIERRLPDGSFVKIGAVAPDQTSFIDMSAEDNCAPDYVYRVRAISKAYPSNGEQTFSLSNEVKVLPYSKLFVPNAFSPDANNINEKFGPKGQYISKYNLKIFNRWGEQLFETSECMQAWDGAYKGEICQQDVYMYIIEAKGADGKIYNLSGTFTLLR